MKRRFENLGFNLDRALIIAGPCSVESEYQVMQTALAMKNYDFDIFRGGIWKPRTRPNSFEGMGKKALPWLKKAANTIQKPCAVEVAQAKHVDLCLENDIDFLWIGARTSVNPFAVQEIADALRGVNIPVFVKNPINPDLKLWLGAIERLENVGIEKVAAIHRGFSYYGESIYRNNPIWSIPIDLRLERPNLPIICDPSHISGTRDLLFDVAQQALDLGFDGLMIETHINPDEALSDAKQQITPAVFHKMTQDFRQRIFKISSKEIEALRQILNELDHELVTMIGKRMEVARKIGEIKKLENVAIYQPEQLKKSLQQRIDNLSDLHLSKSFIVNLFTEIHNESLRQQREIFKKD